MPKVQNLDKNMPKVQNLDYLLLNIYNSNVYRIYMGFLYGSAGKESACNVGDLGSIPELGRYPGEGKGYPLQYSGLENSMDCKIGRAHV